jgi:hypothetical protein
MFLATIAAPLMAGDVTGSWSWQIVFRVSSQEHAIKFNLKPDGAKLTRHFLHEGLRAVEPVSTISR